MATPDARPAKRRRRGGEAASAEPASAELDGDALQRVATEYLMLHLGATKWRARRFAAPGSAEGQTNDQVDQAGATGGGGAEAAASEIESASAAVAEPGCGAEAAAAGSEVGVGVADAGERAGRVGVGRSEEAVGSEEREGEVEEEAEEEAESDDDDDEESEEEEEAAAEEEEEAAGGEWRDLAGGQTSAEGEARGGGGGGGQTSVEARARPARCLTSEPSRSLFGAFSCRSVLARSMRWRRLPRGCVLPPPATDHPATQAAPSCPGRTCPAAPPCRRRRGAAPSRSPRFGRQAAAAAAGRAVAAAQAVAAATRAPSSLPWGGGARRWCTTCCLPRCHRRAASIGSTKGRRRERRAARCVWCRSEVSSALSCSAFCCRYDLVVCDRGGSGVREFVEVKTSRYYDHNVFDLSYFEWDFLSREPPVQYRIYRVSGAAEAAGPRVSVIHDVLRAVKEGSARLCLAI